ncbi:hypothetical protein [Nitrospira sp. Kam-Ns4a]
MLIPAFLLAWPPSVGETKDLAPDNPLNPPAPIFWCPNKTPDQQISVTPNPGCMPIVEKQERRRPPDAKPDRFKDLPPIKIIEIQSAASKFAEKYRQFLDCCAAKIASLDQIDELSDEANYILTSVQQRGLFNSAGMPSTSPNRGSLGTFARQWTLTEIIGTVVRARHDLARLKEQLEALERGRENLDKLDYEAAGRERRRLTNEELTITEEFKAKRPPPSARTGTEIENTTVPTRVGGDIENTTLNSAYSADIGYVVSPYSSVRENLKPRRGTDIADTNLPTVAGPAAKDKVTEPTDLPVSIGFEVGTSQGPTGESSLPMRVGPAIGNSSLNNP